MTRRTFAVASARVAYGKKIKEEELKNKIGTGFFAAFDWTRILGDIDFSVALKSHKKRPADEAEFFLWAESKAGTKEDIIESFVQLILTIGKAHWHSTCLPPKYLGAFDAEKIAFVPYHAVAKVFSQSDFNWNVTPSNHESKEFKQLAQLVAGTLEAEKLQFRLREDKKELKEFIKNNFRAGTDDTEKIQIDKNNFISVYQKWHLAVAPQIAINWEMTKKAGLIDADFYLADLLSRDDFTLKDKLRVLLQSNHYKLVQGADNFGLFTFAEVQFNDQAQAHKNFWKRYVRPPREEFWDFMIERRDLLVPQDVRERKGSFFTPQIWVEKSQEYIARVLGENWQDEYYVWDCCAGTGNLLNGLVNKYNIFASTLDDADVQIMKDRVANGANLLEEHIFKFDFLNDNFWNLPKSLQDIINDPKKRKKLVIYINPPYAEATSATTVTGTGKNKAGVARNNYVEQKYRPVLKTAVNELFAQFFIRIYKEIPGAILAEFSKLKILQAPNFRGFREIFKAKLCSLFLVPADTFDNVKGQFPIGFFVWNTAEQEVFDQITADVYDKDGNSIGTKSISSFRNRKLLTDWLKTAHDKINPRVAYLRMIGSDVQHNNGVFLTTAPSANDLKKHLLCNVTANNLIKRCIYFAVRLCIEGNWLNDRDQFLFPNDSWKSDTEFHSDCLAFTLFHGQNRITSSEGVNHWIPFTEEEVGAHELFSSHFMTDFLRGKLPKKEAKDDLFTSSEFYDGTTPVKFSDEALAVFDAGRELWKYYHSQYGAAADASLYDIKKHFQGVNDKGRMNAKSTDEHYTELITELRKRLKILAAKLEPKVYEHGFLLK